MDTQIVCPRCKKIISNDPLIAAAVKGEGFGVKPIMCECGERITLWAVTSQLKEQKSLKWKIQNWFFSLSNRKTS